MQEQTCALRALRLCDGQELVANRYATTLCPCEEERISERVLSFARAAYAADLRREVLDQAVRDTSLY